MNSIKSSDEEQAVYTHVEKSKQKNAISFLNKNVFATPELADRQGDFIQD